MCDDLVVGRLVLSALLASSALALASSACTDDNNGSPAGTTQTSTSEQVTDGTTTTPQSTTVLTTIDAASLSSFPVNLQQVKGMSHEQARVWLLDSGFVDILLDSDPPPPDNLDGRRVTLTLDDSDLVTRAVVG